MAKTDFTWKRLQSKGSKIDLTMNAHSKFNFDEKSKNVNFNNK